MGTTANIGMVKTVGNQTTVISINCFYDGYLECVGKKLELHYLEEDTAASLIASGDIYGLREIYTECRPADPENLNCTNWQSVDEYLTNSCSDYTYLLHGGEWFVRTPDSGSHTLMKLGHALLMKALTDA